MESFIYLCIVNLNTMKNILCFFGFHKFSNWEHIGMLGKYKERLKRRCKNCGKLDFYDGLVETCIKTGEKKPYKFKY